MSVPHGIMFHHFYGGLHPHGQGAISADELDTLLHYLGLHRILEPAEWLDKLAKNGLEETDLCLTFDDALLNQIDIALPVLEKYKLKAFWFIYSSVFEGGMENLELYRFFRTKYFDTIDDFYTVFFKKALESGAATEMDKESERKMLANFLFYSVNDVRFRFLRDKVLGKENYEKIMDAILADFGADKSELANNLWMTNENLKYLSDNGHGVGLHSYSHPTNVAALSFEEQRDEYQKNYSHIKRVTGRGPVAVAYPCNSYNADTLEILKKFGVICGFRSTMFPKKSERSLSIHSLEIAREDHATIMNVMKK